MQVQGQGYDVKAWDMDKPGAVLLYIKRRLFFCMGTILEDASYSNSLALLRPSVIVDYKRQAFINPEGNVRFTIDSGFKAGAFSDDMLSQSVRYLPVEDFTAVIEIKYDDYLPSYLMDLLGGIELRQDSVSKFILCHDKLTSLNMRT